KNKPCNYHCEKPDEVIFRNEHIILGSASPRRRQLLTEIFGPVKFRSKNVNEDFPGGLVGKEIALFLASKKAEAFADELQPDDLLITADTIVWLDQSVLNKAADRQEAISMLNRLSGNRHSVFTGVCLTTPSFSKTFSVQSDVYFKPVAEKDLA